MRVGGEYAVTKTLDAGGSSDPEISFAIFEQGGDRFFRLLLGRIKRGNAVSINPEQAFGGTNPNVGVAVTRDRQNLSVAEHCESAGGRRVRTVRPDKPV